MVKSYQERSVELYGAIKDVFGWQTMYQQEYALASMHSITREFREEIAHATTKLGEIYAKVINILQQADEEVLDMLGIPPEAWRTIRVPVFNHIVTTLGRFDFAQTKQGLKMLEFNSDTPTSVVEAFYVNARACAYYNSQNPNAGMEAHITQAFQDIVKRYIELGYSSETIVFSSLGWHEEDRGTTEYLLHQSGLNAKFVPLEELRVYEDRLCYSNQEGQYTPIDIWYRLHALEKLAEEKDEVDQYPTGAHVLDLVSRKKLALINPPSAFLAQSKAVQALIWNLHEEGEFFEPEEHEVIEKYMLPTYLENRFLDKRPHVSKPLFGREGGAVRLFSKSGDLIAQDNEENYWEQPMVYQEMVDLEDIEIETLSGLYTGKALWGSFLIGGQASGIGLRVGELITGNLSYFLPVGYK